MTLQLFRNCGMPTLGGDGRGRGAVVHFGGRVCAIVDQQVAELCVAARGGQVKRSDAAAAAGPDAGATIDEHLHKGPIRFPC